MMNQLFSFGNMKQDGDTAIFNMTPTTGACVSEKMGLCSYPSKCYARKAERRFPNVMRHRIHQNMFWNACSPELFIYELKKYSFTKLRFSESGDFRHQEDVSKVIAIANLLSVPVWTYTARRDLDFSDTPDNLIVNGSGFMLDNMFQAVPDLSGLQGHFCKGNCRICDLCLHKSGIVIYTKIH